MGSIYVNLEISNPANPDVSESILALVDTDTMLSVLPADVLERLGVSRRWRRRFLCRKSGGLATRDTGTVNMSYSDTICGATAIFGAEDDPTTIGATALTALGFEAGRVNGRLNRVDVRV